jgi:arabinogalactan endo-1,4-beta-galactosidase
MHGTAFVRLRVNKDVTDEERNMIGGMQAIKTLVVVAAVIS